MSLDQINEACEFIEASEKHRQRASIFAEERVTKSGSLYKAFHVLANAENEVAIALLEEAINDLKLQRVAY